MHREEPHDNLIRSSGLGGGCLARSAGSGPAWGNLGRVRGRGARGQRTFRKEAGQGAAKHQPKLAWPASPTGPSGCFFHHSWPCFPQLGRGRIHVNHPLAHPWTAFLSLNKGRVMLRAVNDTPAGWPAMLCQFTPHACPWRFSPCGRRCMLPSLLAALPSRQGI